MTQAINSYNVLIDRFQTFANGHYMINAFTHGILPAIDEPKDKQYPWMHVLCTGIVQQAGQAEYSWTIYFFDLPRDKADAHENKREALSDCIRLAQDLIYEIDNGNVLFGNTVDLLPGAQIVPGIDEWTNTLTGVELTFTMAVPDDYDACAIPADFSVGSGTDTSTPGVSSLSFSESLNNTDGVVTLDNDQESPGNTKYYGTNSSGVKGWYTLTGGGGGGAVDSVNGQTGTVLLDAGDVGADAAGSAAAALVSANGYTDSAVAGLIPANAPITGATKTKITYDSDGLVTAGADAGISDITGLQSALDAKDVLPVVVSSNQTAANDGRYVNVASATYTDPTPAEGKGFVVFVRNGTATVGGTGYAIAGTLIYRIYHSGAWANYPFYSGIKQDSSILSNTAGATTVAAGSTEYAALFGGPTADSAVEANVASIITEPGVISNFSVRTLNAQPGTGSYVLTVRVNGVDTGIVITIAAGAAAGIFSDTVNTATVAAGDLVSIKLVNNASGASAQRTSASATFTRM